MIQKWTKWDGACFCGMAASFLFGTPQPEGKPKGDKRGNPGGSGHFSKRDSGFFVQKSL